MCKLVDVPHGEAKPTKPLQKLVCCQPRAVIFANVRYAPYCTVHVGSTHTHHTHACMHMHMRMHLPHMIPCCCGLWRPLVSQAPCGVSTTHALCEHGTWQHTCAHNTMHQLLAHKSPRMRTGQLRQSTRTRQYTCSIHSAHSINTHCMSPRQYMYVPTHARTLALTSRLIRALRARVRHKVTAKQQTHLLLPDWGAWIGNHCFVGVEVRLAWLPQLTEP